MQIELLEASARHFSARQGAAPALQALSLRCAAGEQVAVIGPSGAGKTTLLHVLACALPLQSGQLRLNGQAPWGMSKTALQSLRQQLFLAPQVSPLPPRQRVVTAVLAARLPQMGLLGSLKSLFYPSQSALAYTALTRFDLGEKLFDRVDRLSGGERQRVGLARMAAATAQLMLVDEPLSALDPARAEQAMASVCAVAREQGATLVATLHHVEMALKHFPRIIGLREGRLHFDLPASEVSPERLTDLYAQHLDELTQAAPEQPALAAKPLPAVMHCR